MHHHDRHYGRGHGHGHGHGHGRIHFRGPFPNRLDLLERHLEQELADVSDVIEHLRDRDAQPQEQA